jgi:hypothetical protein
LTGGSRSCIITEIGHEFQGPAGSRALPAGPLPVSIRLEEAQTHCQEALRIKPDCERARAGLEQIRKKPDQTGHGSAEN